jgi:hypothetical protein
VKAVEVVFAGLGLLMAAVALRSFARPLWLEGLRGLAVGVGLVVVGLLGGLIAILWSLAR